MVIPCLVFLTFSFGLFIQPANSHAEKPWVTYHIESSDEHVATLTADLLLAAPPETVYAVLADYPHWPELFSQRPTIHSIQRENNRVRVSMTLTVSFLPIGLTLVTETREIPTTILHTTLVQGDFERYDWVWTLRPSQDSQHTKASVLVHVQPSMWIPRWLLEWVLSSGFTDHFQKLRDAVHVRYREQGRTPIISAPPRSP